MNRYILATALLLCLALATGCAQKKETGPHKLRVVATTGMIGDAVKVITSGRVKLNSLMGPGVDPHLYKATKGDLDLLHEADAIFYNGLNLEAKMAEILGKMGRNKTTVEVGRAIDTTLLRHPQEFKGHPDPHIWFDVSMWTTAVERIADVLIELLPADSQLFRQNAQTYVDSLIVLHDWVDLQVQTIPAERRLLVTAHDAFGYFGRAYDIEVKGLQGISTVAEAGLLDVTRMIDLLVLRKIKAVFVESSVPPKAIEAVVDGCRSRGHEVVIGGELFSDAMGTAGTYEGTYLGMVRHNVNTIVNSLK